MIRGRGAPMSRSDVFISYKSEEAETAHWLKSILEKNGISCWIAPECMTGGNSYAAEIPQAIRNCSVFVVILSEKAQTSRWVPKELDQAINSDKVIMPFMLEDCLLHDDFGFYLSNVHRYAAYENKSGAAKKLVQDVQTVLSSQQTILESLDDARSNEAGSGRTTKSPKARSKKKKWILLFAAVLFFAAVLWLFSSFFGRDTDSDGYLHVTLTGWDELSVQQLQKDENTITERLNLFFGAGEYQSNASGDTMELYLPKDRFCGESPEHTLDAYICCIADLYLVDPVDPNSNYLFIPKSAIGSMELLQEIPDEVDASELDADPDEFCYYRLSLTEDFAKENAAQIECLSDGVFVQDVFEGDTSHIVFSSFRSGEENVWFLVYTAPAEHFRQLVLHNLTHEALSSLFHYYIDPNDRTEWQTDEALESWGKNQCTPEQMPSNHTTFCLSHSGQLSKGDLLDAEIALKARLDLVGCSYAFGTFNASSAGTDAFVGIKLPTAYNSDIMPDLLGSSGPLELSASFSTLQIDASNTKMKVSSDPQGVRSLSLQISDTKALKKLKGLAQSSENGGLCLEISRKKPLLWADPDQITDDTVRFTNLCEIQDGRLTNKPLTQETDWLPVVIASLWKQPALEYTFAQHGTGVINDGSVSEFFQQIDYENKALIKAIDALHDGTRARVDNSGLLQVFLNLPVDDSLPETGLLLSEQIFQMVIDSNMIPLGAIVQFSDEDMESGERCRARLVPYFDIENTLEDGYWVALTDFKNGRMTALEESFSAKLSQNEFFQSHCIQDQNE